ncbi:unnamed protein product [Mesocestoides corti]|uniref:FBXO47 ARM repeats region domain-containing protein n=1 Tax=Mesocestoides corti TaxID=53468 RepID=A0A158QSZ5_MESCO|nr:unnamed protein product [Mesocestoides corti]
MQRNGIFRRRRFFGFAWVVKVVFPSGTLFRRHLCHSGFEPKSASNSKGKRVVDPSKTFLIKGACIMGRLRCPSTFYFGHFLRSFLLGCTQNEYQRVFHALVHACFVQNFWLRLTNLLCKRPDESPEDELAIRLFLRRIFLDPQSLPLSINPSWADLSGTQNPTSSTQSDSNHSNSSDLLTSSGYVSSTTISFPGDCSLDSLNFLSPDGTSDALITSTPLVKASGSGTSSATSADDNSSVWPTVRILANILRSYPFVHQARILFILYGPVHKGRLMWNIMCENTAADLKQLSACFGELGRVLNSLWLSGYWSANDTLAVFHEITNTPDGWLAENVACLLHSAGPKLASLIVQHKARKGYVTELAVILTSLCLVQVKIKEDLSGLLSLVGDAVQATGNTHRQEFLDSLSNAFRGVIVDLYEADELDERLEDFSIILKAQSYFFRALLARVYEE